MPSPSGGGASAYIQIYSDAACTNLFQTVKAILIEGTVVNASHTLTIGEKSYEYYDFRSGNRIDGVSMFGHNPPFLSSRNRVPTLSNMYMKNNVYFSFQEATARIEVGYFKVGNQLLFQGTNQGASAENPARCYAITFLKDGKQFIGFTSCFQDFQSFVNPICCVEKSFWVDALRPAYDYSTEPDGDGGQGSGTLPDTGVHTTTHTGVMPSGGRGLHWYIISKAQYNEFQGYLWGEGDTIAKSLWQKFQNKTHSPVSCVVGCYTLPSVFMPTGTAGTSIHIAGITVPVSAYYFSPGYSESVVLDYGIPEPPFGSWLDYCGITAKIHVPFCGEFAVNPEQIWGRNVTVKYCVDHANGNLAALVKAGDHVLAELTGNVAYTIPVAGGDTGTIERLGAVAIGALALGAAESGAAALTAISGAAAGVAGAQYKTHLTNSNLSGNVSSCTNGVGFIEYSKPFVDYPADYLATYGVPAAWNCGSLGNFAGGYGEFDVMASDIWIPNATDAEKDEIMKLIESGVIV